MKNKIPIIKGIKSVILSVFLEINIIDKIIPNPIAILWVANKYFPYEVPNLFKLSFFVSIPCHISNYANCICE